MEDLFTLETWHAFAGWFTGAYFALSLLAPKLRQASERFSEYATTTEMMADDRISEAFAHLVGWLEVGLGLLAAFADAFGWRRKG